MEQDMNNMNLKEIITSFSYWPKIFNLLFKVDKTNLIIITVLNLLNGFIPVISILNTQELINAIQLGKNQSISYILYPFIFYISINFLGSILSQIIAYFEGIFNLKLSFELNNLILEKVKNFNLAQFENSEIYNNIKRAQSEIGTRPYMLFKSILGLISNFVTLISSATLLFLWKVWIIPIIVIIPIIASIYTMKIGHFQYTIQRKRTENQRKLGYFSYILTNDIVFKEIKLYNLADYFISKFNMLNREFMNQDKEILNKQTIISVFFASLDNLIGAILCFLVIKAAYIGEILIGNTISYIRCISNMQTYTQSILFSIAGICQNNLYIKLLFELLDIPVDSYQDNSKLLTIDKIESIEFKNVSFRYLNRKHYSLKNISFVISRGENIAVVGQNGSGKTTLIKLICGFYDNYEGEILVNNISIKNINRESLKQKIGAVFQDFAHYELTYRENISLSNVNTLYNDEVIYNASKLAQCDDILGKLPQKLDTQLGVWFTKGVQLSGGQWQKIAIARAFLREADLYILDEPSSALDPITEYYILRKSYELTKNKIGIFITHRLFNVNKIASRILVIEDGMLLEDGTHEKLMADDKLYKKLYVAQNTDESFSKSV